MKAILLTFDVEEFDIPQEYGQEVPYEQQFEVSRLGLEALLSILEKYQAKATFFCTANFAQHHPELIRHIAQNHEIASHSFYHDFRKPTTMSDIIASKKVLEEISSKPVVGFRMPRLMQFNTPELANHGYQYDASLNPTYLPGRYNFLSKPAQPHWIGNVLEIPSSVLPVFRLPLFWIAFKNIPLPLYKWFCKITLKRRGFLSLYFHPWEFSDLSPYKLPTYVKRQSGQELIAKFENLVGSLAKQKAKFLTCSEFLKTIKPSQKTSEMAVFQS
ncbi:polysaccharide deacetylase family protein [Runella zeae]|uniref:polysaccharide deacetylase family protein n=1 Tax=Runella zeae TaxID=94255 RepID=UPI0004101CA0|nr:polysaccharide deacetylase family protein [Runella zeae]